MAPRIHPSAEVSSEATIGEGSRIWHWAQIREGARVGQNCVVGKDVYVDATVVVGDDCKVENFASIYRGVTIGRNAMVAAGAVVTKDVPPHALVAGVPAKIIGWVCECGRPLDAKFRCAHDGKSYPELSSKRNPRSRSRK